MKKNKKPWKLNWHNPKLLKKKIKNYVGRNKGLDRGYGVFTKLPIKKGEILVIFGGYIIPTRDVKKLLKQLQEYCYQVHDSYFYGPVKKEEISVAEHLNHSCNPNVGFKDSITLVAIKDIKKGEEIVMDYAMCLTSHLFDFKCDCESKNCRFFISGDDWKIKKLQKKYKKYFQPYILEKINNLIKK